MKKTIFTLSLLAVAMLVSAVPAKKGMWQTVKLSDGREVRVQKMGDEHMRFWSDAEGRTYVKSGNGAFAVADMEQLRQQTAERRALKLNSLSARSKAMRKVTMGEKTSYTGQKKGLVILAQYTDVKFKTANNLAKYKRILNEENYTTSEGFRGSVADYFKAQSGGIFELSFDVFGPVTLAQKRSYYGGNSSNGEDQRAEEMIVEAVKAVASEVNMADYDWDGDGAVDQVFVLYAGTGEADSYDDDSVWPHMAELSDYGKSFKVGGITINTYACSNEVTSSGKIEGIGCFCHEFSHCMGFPDMYDTSYSGWFGMSDFDLMCSGSYNGDTFCPAGYSGYEKMMAGWLEPVELKEESVTVNDLAPLSEGGDAYIIYNDGNVDEYYMIENRQASGWDSELPGTGIMISHIDFDKTIWQENSVNTKVTASDVRTYPYLTKQNDHQRITIFHADNNDDSNYWNSTYGYSHTTLTTDLYPYKNNDSLTATSKPAATLYTANSKGKKLMEGAITKMKVGSNGFASFYYRGTSSEQVTPGNPEPTTGTLFYESFDDCAGKGGNDGAFSGNVASATFLTDNEGWVAEKAYGGEACAKFGTGSVAGSATTPAIPLNGTAKLTFKAAAWNATNDGTLLSLSADGGTVNPVSVTMEKGAWTDYEATLTATGSIAVTFASVKGRFFLDEVLVKQEVATGIAEQKTYKTAATNRIYTLDGRYVGTSFSALEKGLYVVNGKKVVK